MVDHTEIASKLPTSIFHNEERTGIDPTMETLVRVFMQELNEYENECLIDFSNPENLSGVQLDRWSRPLGIGRNGMTDEEFRAALVTQPFAFYDRITIPNILKVMQAWTVNPVLSELCYETIEPRFLHDGKRFLSCRDVMHPSRRPAAMRAIIDADLSVDWTLAGETLRRARGNGVGLWIQWRTVIFVPAAPDTTGVWLTDGGVDVLHIDSGSGWPQEIRFGETTGTIDGYRCEGSMLEVRFKPMIPDHRTEFVIRIDV